MSATTTASRKGSGVHLNDSEVRRLITTLEWIDQYAEGFSFARLHSDERKLLDKLKESQRA